MFSVCLLFVAVVLFLIVLGENTKVGQKIVDWLWNKIGKI